MYNIKLLIFFIFLVLLSCTKEVRNDFAVTRIMTLKPADWPDTTSPDTFKIYFVAFDKTDAEMIQDISSNTFSKWNEPDDTIWFYKHLILNGSSCHTSQYFIDGSRVYETMIENANAYTCPKY